MDINAKHKGHSQPPESLIGQLLWREVSSYSLTARVPDLIVPRWPFVQFYHAVQYATPHFNRIRGNPASRFIGWSLQTRFDEKGVELPREEMVKIWQKEEPEAYERYMAWREGRTGFPWIVSQNDDHKKGKLTLRIGQDALMRQVRTEGWMHHLGRHSVACFLTRGQLYISWERVSLLVPITSRYKVDLTKACRVQMYLIGSSSTGIRH